MTERELIEKSVKVHQLFIEVEFPPMLSQFFDLDSDELLDEKIEVLTALKNGKQIADIPNFYDILELYPKGDDGTSTHWD
ncbi:hypothetical protein GPL02_16850 [Clostridium sp. MCC334]|jgi:hypothetical protein|nr:hypothetical protein [Clostridium sp. MCC334]